MPLLIRHRLVGTAMFIGIGLAILFFRLMPLAPGATALPGPEVMLCVTFAWVLRRPDHLPAIIIVAMTLIGDIMLGRPFGLFSLFVLTATEFLRSWALRWGDQPFFFEWLRIAVLVALLLLGYRIVMLLFMLPVPALGPVMLQWLATTAAYPAVVVLLRLAGVRRPTAAELEMMGS